MIKMVSRLLVATAAASLAFAPIAAQANTRASERTAIYNVGASQPGVGREEEGEGFASFLSFIIAFVGAGAVGGGIFVVADSNGSPDDGQSPGT